LVGLAGFETRDPRTLSGGEQQRVALARALAPRPRLLLLDEPFSSLDSDLRTRLAEDVREILQAERATAIVVTHDQDEAFAVADRVAIMSEGRLEDIGPPQRLWSWPATETAARILGCRWFAPCRITPAPTPAPTSTHAPTAALVETPWGIAPLPPDAPSPLPEGEVRLGLRPGAISVAGEHAQVRDAIVRLQSGQRRAVVEIANLGRVDVLVDPALAPGTATAVDPTRIALLTAPLRRHGEPERDAPISLK